MLKHTDIITGRGGKEAALQFGTPNFVSALGVYRGNATVNSDVEIHDKASF
jgi:hypothetical protein